MWQEAAALRDFNPAFVRFGSKADVRRHLAYVRFTPKADNQRSEPGAGQRGPTSRIWFVLLTRGSKS